MKRFYCSVCKRVKRVRKYPYIITTPDAYDVMQRVGVCNHHTNVSGQTVLRHHTSSSTK